MSEDSHTKTGRLVSTESDPRGGFTMRRIAPLLISLYTTQFLGVGFLLVGVTAILREQGLGLTELGILQSVGLIWALKFLYAPLVDRYGISRFGHYRGWLLVVQFFMAVSLGAMAFVEPSVESWQTLFYISAVMVAFSATQDIAADALNVRLVPAENKGLASGFQTVGGYIGNIIGGGLTLLVYERCGWEPAIAMITAMVAITWVMVWFLREPDRTAEDIQAAGYKSFKTMFRNPKVRLWILVILPLHMAGLGMTYSLLTPALVDAGWSVGAVGILLAVVASIPATIGGVFIGWLLQRIGYLRTFLVSVVMSALAVLALQAFFAGQVSTLLIVTSISMYMAGQAMMATVATAVCLHMARGESAGSDFTFMSSVTMMTSFIAGPMGLVLADTLGYFYAGLLAVVLFVVGAVVMAWYLATQWPAWQAAQGGLSAPDKVA